MSQRDFDDAYANGKYIEGAGDYPPRWESEADRFRRDMSAASRCEIDVAYGAHMRERLDLFRPEGTPKGLVVFVHGGYWLAFDKSSWSHLAQGPLARGYAVAMPSYDLCPDVRIPDITRQIAAAILCVAARIEGPIHLTGHSAGGHLVTRMLCNDVDLPRAVRERIAKVVSISGLHDLRPLLRTKMNDDFKMTPVEAARESAVLCTDVSPVPTVAWVGAKERPAFIEQARLLANAWPHARDEMEPARHHFNVIDGLKDGQSPLCRALLGS